jgi:Icc-related predicted phosphoesterase
MVIIDCISDLHGEYPELEGGDLLIVAGDLTSNDTDKAWVNFENWIYNQSYKEKIIIAGNHDNFLSSIEEHRMYRYWDKVGVTYLCDSGTEFEGLKIWGSPWSLSFPGINPHCTAFTGNEEELEEKYKLILDDIDILITHCPPNGILDATKRSKKHVGSISLRNHVMDRIKPKLHVFGHIHEWGGEIIDLITTKFVNASIMNEDYEPVNKPVRVIL